MKELSILLLWVATAINLASAVMNFYCGYQRTKLRKLYEQVITTYERAEYMRMYVHNLSQHSPMH